MPSGLGLYWITNNVVTTLSTVLIKKGVPVTEPIGPAPAAVDPPRGGAQGFGRKFGEVISSTNEAGTKVTIKPPGSVAPPRPAAPAAATAPTVVPTVVDAVVVDEVASDAAGGVSAVGAAAAGAAGGADGEPAAKGPTKRKKRRKKKSNA